MDPTILDGMTIPEGLDLDTLKNNIILECAELEILYSAPSFFRWAVDAWSLKESPTWEKMYKALQIEYNPLENYDRAEEWTENGTHSTADNWTETKDTKATTNSSGQSSASENRNDDHYVTGYNSNALVKQSSDTGITGTTGNNTGSATGTEKGTDTHSGTTSGNTTGSRNGRIHGNIGVTTSQQMLKAEFDLAPDVNMYNIITRSFRNRFCLLIY